MNQKINDLEELKGKWEQTKAVLFEKELGDNRRDREIGELREENQELKLRLQMLVCLLDAKGVVKEGELEQAMGVRKGKG